MLDCLLRPNFNDSLFMLLAMQNHYNKWEATKQVGEWSVKCCSKQTLTSGSTSIHEVKMFVSALLGFMTCGDKKEEMGKL